MVLPEIVLLPPLVKIEGDYERDYQLPGDSAIRAAKAASSKRRV